MTGLVPEFLYLTKMKIVGTLESMQSLLTL